MAPSDATLVERLPGDDSGDELRELYRRYSGELFGFACNALGDRELAEEVVQDVFARAWRHAGDYDPRRASVRTWLYSIARNRIVDARRRASVRPGLAPEAEPESPAEVDRQLEQAVLRWQVAAALARLSPEHREVIRLAHYGGLSLREIAERKGIPLGTVKSRTSYALRTPAPDPRRDGGARVSGCPTYGGADRRLCARLARAVRDGRDARPRGRVPAVRAARSASARPRCPRCWTASSPPTCRRPPSRPRSRRRCSTASRASARAPTGRAGACGARCALPRVAALGAACAAALVIAFVWLGGDDETSQRLRERKLAPRGDRQTASAIAWADDVPAGTRVRLRARGLPPPGGAMYELWCIRADGRWVSGGTFRAGRDGRAEAVLTAAVRPGDYHVMVVTRHTAHGGRARPRPAARPPAATEPNRPAPALRTPCHATKPLPRSSHSLAAWPDRGGLRRRRRQQRRRDDSGNSSGAQRQRPVTPHRAGGGGGGAAPSSS